MPTDAALDTKFTIEPFDAKSQDRTAFSCGVPQIDNYLKLTAKKGSKADVVRIWVVLDEDRARKARAGMGLLFWLFVALLLLGLVAAVLNRL